MKFTGRIFILFLLVFISGESASNIFLKFFFLKKETADKRSEIGWPSSVRLHPAEDLFVANCVGGRWTDTSFACSLFFFGRVLFFFFYLFPNSAYQ